MTVMPLRAPQLPEQYDVTDNATAMFETLTAATAPRFAVLGRLPTKGETACDAIDAAWLRARVISFDVFDTLIVRKVASPRDVFLHLATPAPFSDWQLDAGELASLRQQAENEARRRGKSVSQTN